MSDIESRIDEFAAQIQLPVNLPSIPTPQPFPDDPIPTCPPHISEILGIPRPIIQQPDPLQQPQPYEKQILQVEGFAFETATEAMAKAHVRPIGHIWLSGTASPHSQVTMGLIQAFPDGAQLPKPIYHTGITTIVFSVSGFQLPLLLAQLNSSKNKSLFHLRTLNGSYEYANLHLWS